MKNRKPRFLSQKVFTPPAAVHTEERIFSRFKFYTWHLSLFFHFGSEQRKSRETRLQLLHSTEEHVCIFKSKSPAGQGFGSYSSSGAQHHLKKVFLFSLQAALSMQKLPSEEKKNIQEMPFCSGLNNWISFLMEILTFSFQTQSSRLPERIRRIRQNRLELLICTGCRILAHWLMQRNSNLLKQMYQRS